MRVDLIRGRLRVRRRNAKDGHDDKRESDLKPHRNLPISMPPGGLFCVLSKPAA